jgi:1,4-dihydroxy-2-naphthoate octaprenyltransferase
MAAIYGHKDLSTFILAICSTLGLQILSNLANDYGDGIKGTDNDERIGPKRAYQSGTLSKKELKSGILLTVIITFVLIGLLLYAAFDGYPEYFLLFAVLGAVAVWSAIRYTVGDAAYGYKGLGDLFVFVFFGLLSVLGTMFLFTKSIGVEDILPAVAIGCLSVAVLNLNNMRDYASDSKAGKNTLVVKLGITKAKWYHFGLLTGALLSMSSYLILFATAWYQFICLAAFLPVAVHTARVAGIKEAVKFDPELKIVALSTFFLALFFYLGFNNFL